MPITPRCARWFSLALFALPFRTATADISFARDIAPILADQCAECHRAGKSKGAYRLDTFSAMLRAGDSKAAPITAGKPDQSELLRLITAADEDERMPKKGDPLSAKDQAIFRQWIADGARFDGQDEKASLSSLLPDKPQASAPEKYPRPWPVTALAVNHDASLLAVSGYHEVTLWDWRTGKFRGRIPRMPERVHDLAWIGSSSSLAVAGGTPMRSGGVWLADAAKPEASRKLLAARDSLLTLVVSPDGSRLAAAGCDNRIRMLSLPDGKALWDIEPHADWVAALAFSPDGRHIASAGRDRTARLCDAKTGVIEAAFSDHSSPLTAIAFQPDGKEVFSADSGGQIRRWKLDGQAAKDTTIRPSRQEVTGIGFFDGEIAACAASGLVATVDPKSRAVKEKLARHEDRVNVMRIASQPGGPVILSGSHDGKIIAFDVRTKAVISEFIASPGFSK